MKISTKKYVDSRIASLEKATTLVADGIEKATTIAAAQIDRRLESMNEFRAQLKDQAGTFVTRDEHEKILEDIRSLRESRAELSGKASQLSVNVALIIAVAGLVLNVVRLFKSP